MKSTWSVFTNASHEHGAKKIFDKIVSQLGQVVDEIRISPYHKGGFKIQFNITHQNSAWEYNVYECLAISQNVGYEWQLYGNIEIDPSALTQKANISGVEMIEWQMNKKK